MAQRVPRYRERKYKTGEEVFVQLKESKSWSGPVRVVAHFEGQVWVHHNGNLCKLAECRVRPVHPEDEESDTTMNDSNTTVQFDDTAVTLDQEEEQEQGAEAGAETGAEAGAETGAEAESRHK